MALMISWVMPVNPSHPYLENDPAPSFAPTICAFHLGFSLGCALNHGSFMVNYHESAVESIEESPADSSLVTFLFQLLAGLQAVGTAPAIDYSAYI